MNYHYMTNEAHRVALLTVQGDELAGSMVELAHKLADTHVYPHVDEYETYYYAREAFDNKLGELITALRRLEHRQSDTYLGFGILLEIKSDDVEVVVKVARPHLPVAELHFSYKESWSIWHGESVYFELFKGE